MEESDSEDTPGASNGHMHVDIQKYRAYADHDRLMNEISLIYNVLDTKPVRARLTPLGSRFGLGFLVRRRTRARMPSSSLRSSTCLSSD